MPRYVQLRFNAHGPTGKLPRMPRTLRSLLPWFAVAALVAALAWALNRGQLPPADFTLVNGAEVKSLDPAIVTGHQENIMLNGLFEGLVRWKPDTLEPIPGVAERWEISADRLVYTFHLRETARWTDGSPVTADDFFYSMRRLLDPRTAAEYSYQAWYIKNSRRYNGGPRAVRLGDAVEVELNLPTDALNSLRGNVLRGKLALIEDAAGKPFDADSLAAAAADESSDVEKWTFVVEVDGRERRFRMTDDADAQRDPPEGVKWCRQVLVDFRDVGVRVIDPQTIEFTLENPTPYFLNLLGFYPLYPVQRKCVEKYGSPQWTYVENIVCNGPFKPLFRQLRDRTRLVKNDLYWDREHVRLNTVDLLAVESVTTALNLYLTGKADWIYDMPASALRELLRKQPPLEDINPQPLLYSYFYLLNTTRPPLDDVRVRQALSLALDRNEITDKLLGNGERPAFSLVPPGMVGYVPPECAKSNVEEARRLLAEAGYPGGKGFPTLTILYNTNEGHQLIAQLVRKQWQQALGISVRSRNQEFVSLLASQRDLEFDVSRRGWLGDYADPNTFLEMYRTGAEHNNTGWGDPEYDRLIAAAKVEPDPERRLKLLADAERMLMDQLPILPIYFYVSKNLVKPYVRGFYENLLDTHPIWAIWIDRDGQTPNPRVRPRP